MTRKIVLFIATSIDNYIADEQGAVEWLETNIHGHDQDNSYEKMYAKTDTVIIGKTTYRQVTEDLFPERYIYEDRQTYVITSHPNRDTNTIKYRNQSPVALVQQLKKEAGKDIWIVGGAQIIDPLVKANLIDEYVLTTIPIFLGKGIRLFEEIGEQIPVRLVDVYQKNELVYSIYKRGTAIENCSNE